MDGSLAWLRQHPALSRAPVTLRGALPSGDPGLDEVLGGGLPRGALSEVVGAASTGRTSLALKAAAAATQRGELVAWIDPGDTLDVSSLSAAAVVLEGFLWVRPRGKQALKQALVAADLVVAAGGFGLVVLDLLSRERPPVVPEAAWVRLVRRLHGSGTAVLTLSGGEVVGMSAHLRLSLERQGEQIAATVVKRRGGPPGAVSRSAWGEPVE